MKTCIVLSTQRSGSTLLVDHLSSAPGLLIHSELFQRLRPELVGSPAAPRHYQISYQMYCKSTLARRLAKRFFKRRLIDRYLNAIYAPKHGIDAIGMKLMYDQARRYPEVVDWLRAHDVRFVHLVRQNALQTVVSRMVARKRGTHSMLKPLAAVKVELKVDELLVQLSRLHAEVDHYRQMCRTLNSCEVTYEAFLTDRERETQRILELLDITDCHPVGSRLIKTNPSELWNVISNYDEVARVLSTHPEFSRYLH